MKSKPERGKANRELIQKLADTFKILLIMYILFQDWVRPKN
jgi:hypothetical protein